MSVAKIGRFFDTCKYLGIKFNHSHHFSAFFLQKLNLILNFVISTLQNNHICTYLYNIYIWQKMTFATRATPTTSARQKWYIVTHWQRAHHPRQRIGPFFTHTRPFQRNSSNSAPGQWQHLRQPYDFLQTESRTDARKADTSPR